MNSPLRLCIDKRVPRAKWLEAASKAIEENPVNLLPGLSRELLGAAMTAKKWKNGRTLRVRHVNGEETLRARVERHAREWERHANIGLEFTTGTKADLRIRYDDDNQSWSYIGTDALTVDDAETMHFGWLGPNTDDSEFSRVVLHEFGHALGMIHEHQHPTAGIKWDREAVYGYYAQQGWTRADVDDNLFRKIDERETQFAEYDPDSIMHYPVPADFTTDRKEVGLNHALSWLDRVFMASVYPRPPRP